MAIMMTELSNNILDEIIDLLTPFFKAKTTRTLVIELALGKNSHYSKLVQEQVNFNVSVRAFILALVTCLVAENEDEKGIQALALLIATLRNHADKHELERFDKVWEELTASQNKELYDNSQKAQASPSQSDQLSLPMIHNTYHALTLIQAQLRVGRLDPDFASRQISKIQNIFDILRQEQQETKTGGRFKVLHEASLILGTSLNLQVILDRILDAAIQLTEADRGFILWRDADDKELIIRAIRHISQATMDSDDGNYSRTIANYVLERKESVLTTNAVQDPRFAGGASIVTQSLRTIMATPLMIQENVHGAIYIDNRVSNGLFANDDILLFEALAKHAAIMLENARLVEELEATRLAQATQYAKQTDEQLNKLLQSYEEGKPLPKLDNAASIFISYSREDESFARRLSVNLQKYQFKTWLDVESIQSGSNWASAIQQGLSGADVMLLIISPDSIHSSNVENEWQYFLNVRRKPVIPVYYRPIEWHTIHFQLAMLHYVDFRENQTTFDDAIPKISESINHSRLLNTITQGDS